MMEARRLVLARVMFVLDVLVCAVWVYWSASSMMRMLSGSGSGAFARVSTGVELLFTLLPLIITIALARAAGSTRLARYWRNAHLLVTLAIIILPLMGGLTLMMLSIAVFQPVQVFFVLGAVAIWIASPRRQSPPRDV